jgi:hypothetical protein
MRDSTPDEAELRPERRTLMSRRILSGVVVFLALGIVFSAQSKNGKVQGTVQDETQAFIPGATVTLTNVETKAVQRAITGPMGEYTMEAPAGVYDLKAELPGFQTAAFTGVKLSENQTVQYNLMMRLGRPTPRPQQ